MVQIIKNSILPFVIAACAVSPAPAAPLVRTATRPVIQALSKASIVVGKQVKTYPYLTGILAATVASTLYVGRELGKYDRHVAKLEKEYSAMIREAMNTEYRLLSTRLMQKKSELDAARKGLYFTRGTSYRVAQERFAERYNKSEIAFQEFLKQNPHCAAHLMSVFAFLASLAVSGAAPAGLYSAGKLFNSTKLIKNAQDFSLKMIKPNSILLATFFAASITAKIKIWLDERDRAFRNDDDLLTPEEQQAQDEARAAQEKAEKEAEAQAPLRDYYEELGVAKDATLAQIKKAYRERSQAEHPDKHMESPEARLIAEARFRRVNTAYDMLKDKQSRALYDRHGFAAEEIVKRQRAQQDFDGADFSNFFNKRSHADSAERKSNASKKQRNKQVIVRPQDA